MKITVDTNIFVRAVVRDDECRRRFRRWPDRLRGGWLGGETFVSFDKETVFLITQQGRQAIVPA
jgi:predicted nucleic acid-binding protein